MFATLLKSCVIYHLVVGAVAVTSGGRCFHPDKSVNTIVTMSMKDLEGAFPVNTIATYSCDNGSYVINDASRRCLDNGNWSGIEPYCGMNVANTGTIQNIKGQYRGDLNDILKGFYTDCVWMNSSKTALNIELSQTYSIDLMELAFEDQRILPEQNIPMLNYSLTHDMVSHKSHDITTLKVKKHYSKVVKVLEKSFAVFQYAVDRPSPSKSIYLEIQWPNFEAGFVLCDIALYSRSGLVCGTPDQRKGTLMEFDRGGDSATYQCPNQFKLVGNSVRHCSNGRWSAEAPTCKYGNSDSHRVTINPRLTGLIIFIGLELAYGGRILKKI